MNPKVDECIRDEKRWKEEFIRLRAILSSCPVTEELKWGVPCYAFEGKNIALIHGFKEYCAVLFVNGAVLRDVKGVLVQQTANVQAARQIRFTNVQEIDEIAPLVRDYVLEAIEAEKSGLRAKRKETEDFPLPAELESRFAENPAVKEAFAALSPGRQRAYILYFAEPKQPKTREARVEKCVPRILAGKGLHDE